MIKLNSIYKHSRLGTLYKVLYIAHHSETLEEMVVYQALYDSPEFGKNSIWVRPLSMWEEEVEINGEKRNRFELYGEGE